MEKQNFLSLRWCWSHTIRVCLQWNNIPYISQIWYQSLWLFSRVSGQSLTVKYCNLSEKIMLKCKWKWEWPFPSKYRKLHKNDWLQKMRTTCIFPWSIWLSRDKSEKDSISLFPSHDSALLLSAMLKMVSQPSSSDSPDSAEDKSKKIC